MFWYGRCRRGGWWCCGRFAARTGNLRRGRSHRPKARPRKRAARPRQSVGRAGEPETRTIEGTARRATGTAPPGRLSRTEGQAMPIRWRTRQYERTCDDCGHAWRVPEWAAPLQMQGRFVCGGGERGVPPPAAAMIGETAVAATAHLAERTTAFRRCRECGSEHYKQRSVWSWTEDPNC